MTRRKLLVVALLTAACGFPQGRPALPAKPKLVVAIVIDQFRYDYLTRFRANYSGGIAELLDRGAVFTNARYRQFPTVTAVGHSIFLSGAMPSLSGIIDNQWFDRGLNRQVTSVSDEATQLLGGAGPGSSPRRLLASTLGDEMKAASRGNCRVIGISLKDRAAILPSGHAADGAYWFDPRAGAFVSSTFYFKELPEWVRGFNASRPAEGYGNAQWTPLAASPDYPDFRKKMPGGGPELYVALEASPYANEIVEAFAERAIDAERLGGHAAADLLAVSFSANDYVGHQMGPDSAEVRDMALRVDRSIGKLLAFLDRRLGPGRVVVVLTADHGVAPLPEVLAERKMPGGRQPAKVVLDAIQGALSGRFGEGRWVAGASTAGAYLNRELIASKKLDEAQVEAEAAKAARGVPHVLRAYTRAQVMAGKAGGDAIGEAVANGFYASRSGDVFVVMEPYWIDVEHGTSHGSPFDYDTHVPVIFMGPGVKPGHYGGTIAPNDIAPTLATLLGVETPSCSAGRALAEMLVR